MICSSISIPVFPYIAFLQSKIDASFAVDIVNVLPSIFCTKLYIDTIIFVYCYFLQFEHT